MTTSLVLPTGPLLLRGIHLELTAAIRRFVEDKTSRLFRHDPRLIRVRVDLEHDQTRGAVGRFVAKGHLEVPGNDLLASVSSEDCYKSVDLLVGRLDRMLARRVKKGRARRHDAP